MPTTTTPELSPAAAYTHAVGRPPRPIEEYAHLIVNQWGCPLWKESSLDLTGDDILWMKQENERLARQWQQAAAAERQQRAEAQRMANDPGTHPDVIARAARVAELQQQARDTEEAITAAGDDLATLAPLLTRRDALVIALRVARAEQRVTEERVTEERAEARRQARVIENARQSLMQAIQAAESVTTTADAAIIAARQQLAEAEAERVRLADEHHERVLTAARHLTEIGGGDALAGTGAAEYMASRTPTNQEKPNDGNTKTRRR